MRTRVSALLFVAGLACAGACAAIDAESSSGTPVVAPSGTGECVVLLHGLGRTYRSMADLASAMEAAGYFAVNLDYPSRQESIETLAATTVPEGLRRCRDAGASPIHFVTHSMGGLLVRQYLAGNVLPELGRVVMLAPPNRGSEVADALRDQAWFKAFNGPAGAQLGTGADGIAARLGPVDFPLGVIAGSEHSLFDGWLATRFPGDNDGKVSVARAAVEGMSDMLVLPETHTFIVLDAEVAAQTLHFLRHGRFRRPGAPAAQVP